MNLKFTILERIHLLGLLPQQGDYELLDETRNIRKILSFNEEETRKFDIEVEHVGDQTKVTFNKEVAEDYISDIKLSPRLSSYFTDVLETLSNEKKLHEGLMSLYEKFVLGKK